MQAKIIAILIDKGVMFVGGLFATYYGYRWTVGPTIARGRSFDRYSIGKFLKFAGPVLILVSVITGAIEIQKASLPPMLQWQEFTSSEGHFRVSLPDKPKVSEANVDTTTGTIVVHKFIVDLEGIGFVVRYLDYPSSIVIGDPNVALERELASENKPGQFRLLNSRPTSACGYPAVEYTGEWIAKRGMMEGLMVLADRRLYQLMIAFPAGGGFNGRKQFFNSFEVLARPQR